MRTCPRSATNAPRISRPSSVRIGMFWRLGSLLLNLPVAATAWLKQVGTGPAAGFPSGGHVEGGVDARGLGVHELRQRVDIGAFELLQRAPLEDQPRHVVRKRQFL